MDVKDVAEKPMRTVTTTNAIKIHPFNTTSVHGITKVKVHCIKVNLIAEGTEKGSFPTFVMMISNYCNLDTEHSKLSVSLRNFSAKTIIAPAKTTINQLQQANSVSPIIHHKVEKDQQDNCYTEKSSLSSSDDD